MVINGCSTILMVSLCQFTSHQWFLRFVFVQPNIVTKGLKFIFRYSTVVLGVYNHKSARVLKLCWWFRRSLTGLGQGSKAKAPHREAVARQGRTLLPFRSWVHAALLFGALMRYDILIWLPMRSVFCFLSCFGCPTSHIWRRKSPAITSYNVHIGD